MGNGAGKEALQREEESAVCKHVSPRGPARGQRRWAPPAAQRLRRLRRFFYAVGETNEHTDAMHRGGRTKGDSLLLSLPGDVVSHVR